LFFLMNRMTSSFCFGIGIYNIQQTVSAVHKPGTTKKY